MMDRRKPKFKERLRACRCCGYPISQRHHLLEIAEYEENEFTWQLCANCHELYHIIDMAHKAGELWKYPPETKAGKVWYTIRMSEAVESKITRYLLDLYELSHRAKGEIAMIYEKMYEQVFDTIISEIEAQGWHFVAPADRVTLENIPPSRFKNNYLRWMKETLEINNFVVISTDSNLSKCPYCDRLYNNH